VETPGRGLDISDQVAGPVANNTFISTGGDYGMYITNLSDPDIYSNIIQGFQTGIRAESEVSDISFNDLWDNDATFSGAGLPDLIGEVVTVNSNNDPSDVYANIFQDPLFMAADSFNLQSGSPCIDAGSPSSYDLDGTISDIGAYFYNYGYAPYNLRADSTGEGFVYLSWDIIATDSLQSYKAFYKLTTESEWTEAGTATIKEYTYSGLTNNVIYNFATKAVYPNYESNLSPAISAKPGLADISSTPAYLIADVAANDTAEYQLVLSNSGSMDLEWSVAVDSLSGSGGFINFTKEDYADYNNSENWDIIVPGEIAITRQNNNGLYNPYTDSGWDWSDEGPQGTEWAWGSTEDNLDSPGNYTSWRNAVYQSGTGPRYALNPDDNSQYSGLMSMHIIGTDDYFDFQFHDWTCCGGGGGFSYTRYVIELWGLSLDEEMFSELSGSAIPNGNDTLDISVPSMSSGIHTDFVPLFTNDVTDSYFRVPMLQIVDYTYLTSTVFTPTDESGDPFYLAITSGSIDGNNLEVGDEVAVFDGDVCVGAGMFDGNSPFLLKSYGYASGNSYSLKVWDNSQYRQGTVIIGDITVGDGTFAVNSFGECSFTSTVYLTNDIAISAGQFNLVSLNTYPQDPDAAVVFDGINGLKIVYDDNGGAFIPDYNINTIGTVNISEGYYMFFDSSNAEFAYLGLSIDLENWPLTIQANRWNYISFLPDAAADSSIFDSISDSIDIISSDDGGTWIPALNVNTIGNFQPGAGYKVFLSGSSDIEFTYPAATRSVSKMFANNVDLQPVQFVYAPTGLPYTIILQDIDLDGRNLEVDDEIGVFDGDLCVGATVFTGQFPIVVTAWAGNEEMEISGFKTANPIDLKLYSTKYKAVYPLIAEFRNEQEAVFDNANYSVAKHVSTGGNVLPDTYALGNNYPNPFNPTTVIPYQLPEDTRVRITVYNMLGQEVAVLVDEFQLANFHRISWKGKDTRGKSVPSGVYIYRLETPAYQKTNKLLLLK
jgi:hypothetical protein